MFSNALSLIIGLFFALSVWAQEAGVVTHLSGTLTSLKSGAPPRLLSVKSTIIPGEVLVTQENSFARIKFSDGGEVVLRPNTQFSVDTYTYHPEQADQDNLVVGLIKGGMRMVTGLLGKRAPERVNVNTVTATIGIRGTHFGLLMCQNDCNDVPTISGNPPADGLYLDVAEGAIHVSNPAGEQLIGTGQFGYVQNRQTPPALVPANQGIQVTMPANISQNRSTGRSVGQARESSECAVQ